MCCGCWQDDGAPKIDTQKVRLLAALIAKADDCGPLHVVIGDDNYETETILWCRDRETAPWSQEDAECCDALLAATFEERVSAAGILNGCWEPERGPEEP